MGEFVAQKHASDALLFLGIYCRAKLTFVPGIVISLYNHAKLFIFEGPKAKPSGQIEDMKVSLLKGFVCSCCDALRRAGKEISAQNYVYIALDHIAYF